MSTLNMFLLEICFHTEFHCSALSGSNVARTMAAILVIFVKKKKKHEGRVISRSWTERCDEAVNIDASCCASSGFTNSQETKCCSCGFFMAFLSSIRYIPG